MTEDANNRIAEAQRILAALGGGRDHLTEQERRELVRAMAVLGEGGASVSQRLSVLEGSAGTPQGQQGGAGPRKSRFTP